MKKVLFLTVLLAAASVGLARAYDFDNCNQNPNSKACQNDAKAFAKHHNGVYPDQYYNQYYQGQRGHWQQNGNQWQWNQVQGDDYYQGHRGHWYRDRDRWRYQDDRDDRYENEHGSWRWTGRGHEKRHHTDRDHDHD